MAHAAEPWDVLEREARAAFARRGAYPLRAYSEFMPPPRIGFKPYAPTRALRATTHGAAAGALEIDEYEQAHDLEPGFDRIAERVSAELARLARGEAHALSKTLLDGNPAWPEELAAAARTGRWKSGPLAIIVALALSRTQDDKGNSRWTLFGTSHAGPGAAFWRGLDRKRLAEVLSWLGADPECCVLAGPDEVPAELGLRVVGETVPAGVRTVLTFRPFAELPADLRHAYLAGERTLVPHPVSLVWWGHRGYGELATVLPRARQIPLLHLFPRVQASCAIRIPQSGWLDEKPANGRSGHGHRVVGDIVRTHRWQRVERDDAVVVDGAYSDKVSRALFATDPDALGLYGKPMAKNAEVWTERYELLLHGPSADAAALLAAAQRVDRGGRFGYRMYWPPMQAGVREVFWHAPLVVRRDGERFERFPGLLGYASAEREGQPDLDLRPTLLDRESHRIAARCFERDRGRARHTTSNNVRKLLMASEHLGAPLSPSFARALVRLPKTLTVESWLGKLPMLASDPEAGRRLATTLGASLGSHEPVTAPLVLGSLATRAFEEAVWTGIARLAEGEFRQKDNADAIPGNRGRTGGPAAAAARIATAERRDLEALGDHLHARYRDLIAAAGMTGKAEVLDHVFTWETDFPFAWMGGWQKNQDGTARERNIVVMIPGRDRSQAVVMGDHYDTAYMEDVFQKEQGGDGLRAPASGADDNHSATTALLLAAEQLLPLAKAGKLARDVWLVHLTGEEFPADCLGARALCSALVERRLELVAEDGTRRDCSQVSVVAAFVLDMIGHNSDREPDVFQIATGEGVGAAWLGHRAHRANLAWNRVAAERNRAEERRSAGRARRMPDGRVPPPLFAHLPLEGEVRAEWEPRSALFNTDGQIFSDVGIPVVLFMENYDITRKGYHDTHDTMANIDLDYCAALTAIAIETVADVACAAEPFRT